MDNTNAIIITIRSDPLAISIVAGIVATIVGGLILAFILRLLRHKPKKNPTIAPSNLKGILLVLKAIMGRVKAGFGQKGKAIREKLLKMGKIKCCILVGIPILIVLIALASIFFFYMPDSVQLTDPDISEIYGLPFKPILLKLNEWEDGDIEDSSKENWYSIDVIEGTRYYVWLNSSYPGDGTKALVGSMAIFKRDGSTISRLSSLRLRDNLWDRPESFKAAETGKVYLKVYPASLGNIGNYSLIYNTSGIRKNWKQPRPVPLTPNKWEVGDIIDSLETWYSFSVIEGTNYYLWLNGLSNGDGSKALDVSASGFYRNGASAFVRPSMRYNIPWSFNATATGTLYVRVYPSSPGNIGNYGIAYSADSIMPDWTPPSTPARLKPNELAEGNIFRPIQAKWFSIDVTEGTKYYLWYGATQNIKANGFYRNGEYINLSSINSTWDYPASFTAASTGTVYIEVYRPSPYNISYSIVYNTDGNIRSGWSIPEYRTPTRLKHNEWENDWISREENWFSIDVEEGTKYYLWCHRLDGIKTLDIGASGFYGDGKYVFTHQWNLKDTVISFTAASTDTVNIRVYCSPVFNWEDIIDSTYSIAYSTSGNIIRPGWTPPADPIPARLKHGEWEDGNITSPVKENWHSIEVAEGTTYYLWLNTLRYGDGTKTLTDDNAVEAVYGNGAYANIRYDGKWNRPAPLWDRPASFTAVSTGTIYIRVYSFSSHIGAFGADIGTYSIVYSTNDNIIRPGWTPPSNPDPAKLKPNEWGDGNITGSVQVNWHSIDVTEGTKYYVWLNTSWNGDGTKKLNNTIVEALSADGAILYRDTIYEKDNPVSWNRQSFASWNNPGSFTAASTGTVYVGVYSASSNGNDIGTYGISYSTSSTRPE